MSDWRSLLVKSLDKTRDMPESRFFQLATIDQSGFPQNRTVVCRGFDETESFIWVITDGRNNKIPELQANAAASICWYFTKTREQYRLAVTSQVETPRSSPALCEQHWQRLSVAAKQQFLWGQPGSLRTDPKRSLIDHAACVEKTPEHFCVVQFSVRAVDYLNLRGNPQTRKSFQLVNNHWRCENLIP